MNSINHKIKNIISDMAAEHELNDAAIRTMPLIDFIYLEGSDTETTVKQLCDNAITPNGHVAAVCVRPRFVKLTKTRLSASPVRVVSHIDMLSRRTIGRVITDIERAIADEASGIEVIFPYEDFLAGRLKVVEKFIRACSMACAHQSLLKLTLEVNEFPDLQKIYEASQFVIDVGADFIKTSTPRKPVGVTLEIAAAILLAIQSSGETIGFKAAIGIDTVSQAAKYLTLTDTIMGSGWATPETFRFGADDRLLNDIKRIVQ